MNETGYYIATSRHKGIVDHKQFNISAYYTDPEIVMSEFAVLRTDSSKSISRDTKFAVINKVVQTADQSGSRYFKINYWQNGVFYDELMYENAYFNYSATDENGNTVTTQYNGGMLKAGDVIVFGYDNDHIIDAFELLYSAENDKIMSSWAKSATSEINQTDRMCYGYAGKILKDGIIYKVTDDINQMTDDSLKNYNYYTGFTKYVYYNKKTRKIYSGSLSNIKSFEAYGNKASRLIMQINSAKISSMFIVD